jgi:hypothetical protein
VLVCQAEHRLFQIQWAPKTIRIVIQNWYSIWMEHTVQKAWKCVQGGLLTLQTMMGINQFVWGSLILSEILGRYALQCSFFSYRILIWMCSNSFFLHRCTYCCSYVLLAISLNFLCFQILLFNCMTVRDPQRLLPCLLDTCAQNGTPIKLPVSFLNDLLL